MARQKLLLHIEYQAGHQDADIVVGTSTVSTRSQIKLLTKSALRLTKM